MKNKRINGLIGALACVVVAAAVVVGVVLRNRSQPLSSGEIDALRTKYPQYSTTIIDTMGDCDRLANLPKKLPQISLVRVTRLAGEPAAGSEGRVLVPVRVDEVLYRSAQAGDALNGKADSCTLAVADAAQFPEGSYVLAVQVVPANDLQLAADTRGGMYVTDSGHVITMDGAAELFLQPYNGSTLKQFRAAVQKELGANK